MSLASFAHRAASIIAFLLLCIVITWVATAGRAFAATATITWQNATQREDGTALAAGELAETLVEYGKCVAGNQFPPTADGTKVIAFPGTSVVIDGLAFGRWCFRARHKDSAGVFSAYTGPVWSDYIAPPKPPTILTVQSLVWEVKMHPTDGLYLARVVGEIAAGKPCVGLAPQLGFDLFTVNRSDVTLRRGVKPQGMLVAQCTINEA